MIVVFVEPSGESPPLARAELAGAVRALAGRTASAPSAMDGLLSAELPAEAALSELTHRLALARRVLVPYGSPGAVEEAAREAGTVGGPAAFRRLGRPTDTADAAVRKAGRQYVLGGGSIDLDAPRRRFWIATTADGEEALLLEMGAIDRRAYTARAMPRLPFRRPVSLAPRLGRALVNLASVRPGDRVLDPFLGTGALVAEAALLGARTFGIDRDPAMVRGALVNLAHLGVRADAVAEGDARDVEVGPPGTTFHAIVTDPPYGRSSRVGGDPPAELASATLARWAARVVPGGHVAVACPGGPPSLPPPWTEEVRLSLRVHRSLTREFRVYRRRG